jgi:hypothetical protein
LLTAVAGQNVASMIVDDVRARYAMIGDQSLARAAPGSLAIAAKLESV